MRSLLLMIFLVAALFAPPAVCAVSPVVAASIAPLHAIAAYVAHGAHDVTLILPPNASVHGYHLKPSQMGILARADVVFYGGEALEAFMPKALLAANRRNGVALMSYPQIEKLPARSGVHAHAARDSGVPATDFETDGHFWFSLENAAQTALIMADVLSAKFPEHAATYRRNADEFARRARAMKDALKQDFAPYKNRPYLVSHDAFQYFEKDAGITPAAFVTPDAERAQIGVKRMARLRELIRRVQPVCLFTEAGQNAKFTAPLTEGLRVYGGVLDPTGASIQTGRDFYFDLIHALRRDLIECLEQLPESDRQ